MLSQFSINTEDPTDVVHFRFLDAQGNITKASIKTALKSPYPVKYYVNTFIAIAALTIFLLWNFGIIPGNQLGFFCNDSLFSHKYRGDTVTPWMLGVGLVFFLPSIFLLVECAKQSCYRDIFTLANLCEFYVYLKQLIIGELVVGSITEIAKTIVGEHRPHFFDTCMPDTNLNCTAGDYVFEFTCTNPNVDKMDWIDASRSFPSGHSSISWFASIFCAYMIHSRLPTHRAGTAFKILLLGVCITFGLMCSLTRITDRRHHWWDVLVGTTIGVLGAAYMVRYTHLQIKLLQRKMASEDIKEHENISLEV
ncbi:phospholipid phosphatase 1-like [Euwallacea similis]|uniref:phospholipid phosphatase 1-like n=1 Tax=Euwallacea similis TaxID=1736056 RepID=UPI0034504E93